MDNMSSQSRLDRLQSLEGIQLTERTYNLAIGITLMAGILLDLMISFFLTDVIVRMSPILMMVLYLVGSFGFTFLIYYSKNPAISFLGFMGLAAAMGMLLTSLLTLYDVAAVQTAFLLTGLVFVVMVVLSTAFPQLFLSIGRGLGVALLITIVVEAVAALIFHSSLKWTDYVVVLIFCGYTGYDWARAQQFPKTLDNAIDSAADIYVDVVNLFIRILRIVAQSKQND